jgi:hypothetical protein
MVYSVDISGTKEVCCISQFHFIRMNAYILRLSTPEVSNLCYFLYVIHPKSITPKRHAMLPMLCDPANP